MLVNDELFYTQGNSVSRQTPWLHPRRVLISNRKLYKFLATKFCAMRRLERHVPMLCCLLEYLAKFCCLEKWLGLQEAGRSSWQIFEGIPYRFACIELLSSYLSSNPFPLAVQVRLSGNRPSTALLRASSSTLHPLSPMPHRNRCALPRNPCRFHRGFHAWTGLGNGEAGSAVRLGFHPEAVCDRASARRRHAGSGVYALPLLSSFFSVFFTSGC